MKQLELFERPRLMKKAISTKDKETLEEIAAVAVKEEFLCGENWHPDRRNPEARMKEVKSYLDNKDMGIISYTIEYRQQVVGCAFIWDGRTCVAGGEYYNTSAELAFIHPDYKQYKADIMCDIEEEIEEINKDW